MKKYNFAKFFNFAGLSAAILSMSLATPEITIAGTMPVDDTLGGNLRIVVERNEPSVDVSEFLQTYKDLEPTEMEMEIFYLINEARAREGLVELTINHELRLSTRFKNYNMVEYNYYAHDTPNFGSFNNIVRKFYDGNVGEVLHGIIPNAQEVVEAWMNSPAHHDVLMHEAARSIGINVLELDTPFVTNPDYSGGGEFLIGGLSTAHVSFDSETLDLKK